MLISDASSQHIEDFANGVGARVDRAGPKIVISAVHVSIVFLQPERYSRLIGCQFWFSSDVGFFYEDIRAALSGRSATNFAYELPDSDHANPLRRNDDYVKEVLEFSRAHWREMIKKPPAWYDKAVQIADEKIRARFPAIADEDLQNKLRLLALWQTSPD